MPFPDAKRDQVGEPGPVQNPLGVAANSYRSTNIRLPAGLAEIFGDIFERIERLEQLPCVIACASSCKGCHGHLAHEQRVHEHHQHVVHVDGIEQLK